MTVLFGIFVALVFGVFFTPGFSKKTKIFQKYDFFFLFLLLIFIFGRFSGLYNEYQGSWPGWSWTFLDASTDQIRLSNQLPWIFFSVGDNIFNFQPVFLSSILVFILVSFILRIKIKFNGKLFDYFVFSILILYISAIIFWEFVFGNQFIGELNVFNLGYLSSQFILFGFILLLYVVTRALFRITHFGLFTIFAWGIIGLVANLMSRIYAPSWLESNFNYWEISFLTIVGILQIMFSSIKVHLLDQLAKNKPEFLREEAYKRSKINE